QPRPHCGAEVHLIEERRLIEIGKQGNPSGEILDSGCRQGFHSTASGRLCAVWEHIGLLVIVVQGQSDLLQIVLALRPSCCLAGLLNGRQQQGDEDSDDRDHHQQLDQGEPQSQGLLSISHWRLLQKLNQELKDTNKVENRSTDTCPSATA